MSNPTPVAILETDRKPPQTQQLPSLRTLIDLPPLQPSTGRYETSQLSPPSPYVPLPQPSSLPYGNHDARSPISVREYHSAHYGHPSASYFDDHYDKKERPASEASFRPSTRHGHLSNIMAVHSPGSTTSTAPSIWHGERHGSNVVTAEPHHGTATSDISDSTRTRLHYLDSHHPSYIIDTRSPSGTTASVTQPRCIGQGHVPGKGLCYLYDDGSSCEVVVRGEHVNPEWGITRAGRARKRLAKACNGCREKKVRCERGTNSRCARCSRKGQECQWTQYSETSPDPDGYDARSTARHIYSQPPEPSYDQHYRPGHVELTPPCTVSSKNSYEPVSALADMEARPLSKRLRSESPEHGVIPRNPNDSHRHPKFEDEMAVDDQIATQPKSAVDWEMDPYHSDPVRAQTLLHLYFEYRDNSITSVLPRESFWRWVRAAPTRSHDQIVLVNSILAVGSLFSHDPNLTKVGVHHANLARLADIEMASRHSLSLALARLHLAFYHFAAGSGEQSSCYLHSGLRTIHALQLNVEEGVANISPDPAYWDFGLNRTELIECRRRVFWFGYLTERHCSFVSSMKLFTTSEQDIFLHLPNNERQYQTGVDTFGPYFDGGLLDRSIAHFPHQPHNAYHMSPPQTPSTFSDLGAMALSVTVAQIWGDVQRFSYRSLHSRRPHHSSSSSLTATSSYAVHYEAFASDTLRRLADWEYSLPGHLQYSQTNTWRNIRCGSAGDLSTYLALHCVSRATLIHLARFVRWQELPPELVKHNIRAANAAAKDLLALAGALAKSFDAATATLPFAALAAPNTAINTTMKSRHRSPPNNHNSTATFSSAPMPAVSPSLGSSINNRAFAQPIVAHALLLAADTVSSFGNIERHHRDTLRSLSDVLAVIRHVAAFFATAAEEEALLRRRIAMIEGFSAFTTSAGAPMSATRPGDSGSGRDNSNKTTWRCTEPCALVWMAKECDIAYGVEEGLYAEAMAVDSRN